MRASFAAARRAALATAAGLAWAALARAAGPSASAASGAAPASASGTTRWTRAVSLGYPDTVQLAALSPQNIRTAYESHFRRFGARITGVDVGEFGIVHIAFEPALRSDSARALAQAIKDGDARLEWVEPDERALLRSLARPRAPTSASR